MSEHLGQRLSRIDPVDLRFQTPVPRPPGGDAGRTGDLCVRCSVVGFRCLWSCGDGQAVRTIHKRAGVTAMRPHCAPAHVRGRFSGSATRSRGLGSNRRLAVYETAALPAELPRRGAPRGAARGAPVPSQTAVSSSGSAAAAVVAAATRAARRSATIFLESRNLTRSGSTVGS